MVIYKPQNGTTLPETINNAINYAKVLYKQLGYGYVEVHFQDLVFGVNEKSDIQVTTYEVYQQIKYKYQKQGGVTSPTLESEEYWIDKIIERK
jgi:hypothetical protein